MDKKNLSYKAGNTCLRLNSKQHLTFCEYWVHFSAHLPKHFTQKPSPQQDCNIMPFKIIATVNPIGSMKTWGKSSCTLFMKEII